MSTSQRRCGGSLTPAGELFEKSLTVNPSEIKLRLVASASLLPNYLNLVDSAIPQANRTTSQEGQRLDPAVAEAEREVRERDQDMERELKGLGRQATRGGLSRSLTGSDGYCDWWACVGRRGRPGMLQRVAR